MLNTYLNQTASLCRSLGTDERGQTIYSAPVTVRCRRQNKISLSITAQNQTAVTRQVYYLEDEIKTGDLLDGYIITAVAAMNSLGGNSIGYKAEVAV